MKRLIIICFLFILVAYAHNKPMASPSEVNDYLNKITERSNIDFLDRVNTEWPRHGI